MIRAAIQLLAHVVVVSIDSVCVPRVIVYYAQTFHVAVKLLPSWQPFVLPDPLVSAADFEPTHVVVEQSAVAKVSFLLRSFAQSLFEQPVDLAFVADVCDAL